MARLIPSFMDDRTPPGERDVFNMLAAGPDDWVALHSLDLAPLRRGLRTEIDFVVIIPDTGILCIEVKSQDAISFENDRWNPPDIKRSPFKQASDGRFTFYRRLTELVPALRHVPVLHCCIFPNASFDLVPNLSVQPWELMDVRTFRSFSRAIDFCADVKDRMLKGIWSDRNLNALVEPLSTVQVDTIVKCCLPFQRNKPNARDEIKRREQQLALILREQQKPALQLTALNDRVIVTGAAGTGKTLIAMEVARRAALDGRRVGLICFNQLVGDWMRRQVEFGIGVHPNLIVGRAIRLLAEMAAVNIPKDPDSAFWNRDLPEQLEDRLTDPDFKATAAFEYLVVDEAQDLLARPKLWECLMGFLENGCDSGSFCLFGDFENQVISDREAMLRTLAYVQKTTKPAYYRLSENCRNYRIVGDSAVRLSGFDSSVYSGYMRVGGGIKNYDIFFYQDGQEQREKLLQWLTEFKAQGYMPSEITLLSFCAAECSAGSLLAKAGFNLRPAWQQSATSTGYASVHAFKGLENQIIVLTDVVLNSADFHRSLFYTGMTRAKESVRILCDKKSQDTLLKWITGASHDG
jgi:hypothetical protein